MRIKERWIADSLFEVICYAHCADKRALAEELSELMVRHHIRSTVSFDDGSQQIAYDNVIPLFG